MPSSEVRGNAVFDRFVPGVSFESWIDPGSLAGFVAVATIQNLVLILPDGSGTDTFALQGLMRALTPIARRGGELAGESLSNQMFGYAPPYQQGLLPKRRSERAKLDQSGNWFWDWRAAS